MAAQQSGVVERPHGDAAGRQARYFGEQEHSMRRAIFLREGFQFLGESLKAEVDRQACGVLFKQGARLSEVGVSGSGADNFQ